MTNSTGLPYFNAPPAQLCNTRVSELMDTIQHKVGLWPLLLKCPSRHARTIAAKKPSAERRKWTHATQQTSRQPAMPPRHWSSPLRLNARLGKSAGGSATNETALVPCINFKDTSQNARHIEKLQFAAKVLHL